MTELFREGFPCLCKDMISIDFCIKIFSHKIFDDRIGSRSDDGNQRERKKLKEQARGGRIKNDGGKFEVLACFLKASF
jgi:hypothetical protein